MTDATKIKDFKRCNAEHKVVSAAWTVNGRSIKGELPNKWNYMRVKLKSGEEFLLSAQEVKAIGEMKW